MVAHAFQLNTQEAGGSEQPRATERNFISINNRTKNCGHYLKFIAGQLLLKQLLTNQYLHWNIQFSSISHNLKDILIVGKMLFVSFQWEMEDIAFYLGYPFMCLNLHQQAGQSFHFESSQCLYLPPYFFYISFPPPNNGYITFLLSQIYSPLFKMRMG